MSVHPKADTTAEFNRSRPSTVPAGIKFDILGAKGNDTQLQFLADVGKKT
jgi:hypothetical protein